MMADSQERLMVLKMLEEGRIGVEEAEGLLAALERAEAARKGTPEPERDAEQGPSGPGFDFRELSRGLREAARGLGEELQKALKHPPWGDLGDWLRGAFGEAHADLEREISLPRESVPSRIVFRGTSGDVLVRGGDGESLEGKAAIRVWAADAAEAGRLAERVHVFTERKDDALEIAARFSEPDPSVQATGSAPRHEMRLELTLPRATGLTVNTSSGNVDVVDLAGDVLIETTSGKLLLRGLTGSVTVHSASGRVHAEDCRPRALEARTSSGDIAATLRLPAGGSALLETASGNVTLLAGEECRMRIEASTGSGTLGVRAPIRTEELAPTRLVGVLGSPDASLRIRTGSGNIRIDPLPSGASSDGGFSPGAQTG